MFSMYSHTIKSNSKLLSVIWSMSICNKLKNTGGNKKLESQRPWPSPASLELYTHPWKRCCNKHLPHPSHAVHPPVILELPEFPLNRTFMETFLHWLQQLHKQNAHLLWIAKMLWEIAELSLAFWEHSFQRKNPSSFQIKKWGVEGIMYSASIQFISNFLEHVSL